MPHSIFHTLQLAIAASELAPGSALDEAALCRRFGVSRTPVREALLRLAAQGYVKIRPRAGIYVTELAPQELLAMVEVLAELESMCARLCARRMDARQKDALQQVHADAHAAAECADVDAYEQANADFHAALHAGCRNAYLVDQLATLRLRTAPYRRYRFQDPARLKRSWREHDALVDALLAGDEDRAEQCAQAHITAGGREFADVVAVMPITLPLPAPVPSAAHRLQRVFHS